ncbi:DUF2293 domain-containing protein [Pseudahrensia aquimaris]|uniref:DUF2293 domain-containing protein n=1 Tax=Pseudahrensia aquimaris TaxID=744461 RepID=A0ABW3FFE1_9HYPH
MATRKQQAQREALRTLIPLAPMADFEPVYEAMRARHMVNLDIRAAAWLATVAHIRHRHTEYDRMRDEGYDHESARHFILEDINDVLEDWGSPRRLAFDEDDEEL